MKYMVCNGKITILCKLYSTFYKRIINLLTVTCQVHKILHVSSLFFFKISLSSLVIIIDCSTAAEPVINIPIKLRRHLVVPALAHRLQPALHHLLTHQFHVKIWWTLWRKTWQTSWQTSTQEGIQTTAR